MQPVILRNELGGKSKWLPLNFRYDDMMRTGSIALHVRHACQLVQKLSGGVFSGKSESHTLFGCSPLGYLQVGHPVIRQ